MSPNTELLLNNLQDATKKLANEMNAGKTFDRQLTTTKKRTLEEHLFVLVQFIAALNGDICSGLKIKYKDSLTGLLIQLDELNTVIQFDKTIQAGEKERLSAFIDTNIASIGNVLSVSFHS
jgi:hypothetical protein